ncbi:MULTISPECIES: GNAT family N-acetyltransferase [Enterococcus]|uniref:GNAT family N-acetyltransferase n=1 Tax=Enterococcus TaxID=1350 RepID=UPI001A8DA92E|nr:MULTISPECIES: GNAT family N-acetyltransferase [unclassified Enterococcus]MBO0460548.1 GNAT family N-acetyltransferase [Enterococcus sp. DIV1298c]MBO0489141.1 GNAT family N-acetyltransferase [Enterococcus sp. DIV1094]MBO1298544.1 GNAT family N-acetyltransferase [Enterococcus sp. DIV1271a]
MEKVAVTEKELDELVAVIHEVWPEAFTPIIGQRQVAYMLETYQSKEQIEKECAAGVSYFLLKLAGRTVGYTAYEKIASSIYLSKLYILQDVRGKGLTSEVFRWYEQLARETEAQEIFLRVNQDNRQAIAVYQHQGFVIEEELISDIGEGFQMVDYKMKKRLA